LGRRSVPAVGPLDRPPHDPPQQYDAAPGCIRRGDYDTGVFAYNFIRRGERYGLRIVGSLKSKPALNVLAAYEI
jgi:hypothetical protein